jgi:hypothetical protein
MSKDDWIILVKRHCLLGGFQEFTLESLLEEFGMLAKYILMENPWSLFTANIDLDDGAVHDQPVRVVINSTLIYLMGLTHALACLPQALKLLCGMWRPYNYGLLDL